MKKIILSYGIPYGIISMLLVYASHQGWVGLWSMIGIGFVLSIIVLIISIYAYRRTNNGYSSFKDIFKLTMGVGLLAALVSTIFNLAYTQTLSEEQKQAMVTGFVDSQMDMYEGLGIDPPPGIEEQLEEQMQGAFDLKSLLINIPSSIFSQLIISVILGLIFKREPDKYEDSEIA